jgi:hypothetical protein
LLIKITGSTFELVSNVILNKVLIPKVIKESYPHLDQDQIDQLTDYVVASSVMRSGEITTKGVDKFISFSNRLVNVNELDMDLIYSINPFQNAFEVMSKQLSPKVFKAVQQCIQGLRISMTDDVLTLDIDGCNCRPEMVGQACCSRFSGRSSMSFTKTPSAPVAMPQLIRRHISSSRSEPISSGSSSFEKRWRQLSPLFGNNAGKLTPLRACICVWPPTIDILSLDTVG